MGGHGPNIDELDTDGREEVKARTMGHVRPCDGPRWHSSAIHACRDNSAISNHEARSAQARGQHHFALFGAAAGRTVGGWAHL